jgi:hypothetical protein
VAASLVLHGIAFYSSRGWSLLGYEAAASKPREIEVSLAPLPAAVKKPAPKKQTAAVQPSPKAPALPRPTPPVIPERNNNIPVPFAPKPVVRIRGVAPKDAEKPISKTETETAPVKFVQPLPAPTMRPREMAGGKYPDRKLTPLPLGVESGDRLATITPQPRVLRDSPQNARPLGPQDIRSGSGAAPGPKPVDVAKADTEPLPAGNNGTSSGSGNPKGSSSGTSGDEGGSGAGQRRGIPFGDPGGVLQGGDPNGGGGVGGGPGGPGRGGSYGTQRGGGAGAPIHVVYILDISDSMNKDDKIDKAKEALKQALEQLTPQDTFNIVYFFDEAYRFKKTMVPASPEVISAGEKFVNSLKPRGSTNYSAALTLALALPEVTHVVLMSDGLPTLGVGVDDYTMEVKGDELLKWIRYQNVNRAHILTIGIGAGQKWDGIELLRDIAGENKGTFRSIDMNKR